MSKILTDRDYEQLAAIASGEASKDSLNEDLLPGEEASLLEAWDDMAKSGKPIDFDVDKAWNKLNNSIEDDSRRKLQFPSLLLKIAAVMVVVLTSMWLTVSVIYDRNVMVATNDFESNVEVLLTDGSRVVLNKDSKLTYNRRFNKNRDVTLSGEAFFEVARDEKHPFTVRAGRADITVLGTSFNVITDNENDETEVFVESGKVQVSSHSSNDVMILDKDFVGKVSENYSTSEHNNDANYMSWNTHILRYNGEQLSVVFSDLKKLYNIDIVATNEEINTYTLTSVFNDQPEDMIIRLLCTTFGLEYINKGNIYVLSLRQ